MADAVGFKEDIAVQNIRKVNPDIKIVKTSAKNKIGIDNLAKIIVSG